MKGNTQDLPESGPDVVLQDVPVEPPVEPVLPVLEPPVEPVLPVLETPVVPVLPVLEPPAVPVEPPVVPDPPVASV